MTRYTRWTIVAIVLMGGGSFPRGAHALESIIPFQSMFEKLNGLAVWGSTSWTHGEAPRARFGRYGMELMLGPYDVGGKKSALRAKFADARDTLAVLEMRDYVTRHEHLDPPAAAAIVNKRNEDLKLLKKATYFEESHNRSHVLIGLGYEYMDGFNGPMGDLNVRVPVKGFYVASYVERDDLGSMFRKEKPTKKPVEAMVDDMTLPAKKENPVGGYIGAIIGLFETAGASAYGPNGYAVDINRNTVSVEGVVGLNKRIGGSAYLFVETGYRYLVFEGLRFDPTAGIAPPPSVPRRLDLTGPQLTVGIQIAKSE